jgi:carbonic anhydrase
MPGVLEARRLESGDAFRNAVVCNAKNAVAQLLRESSVTRRAHESGLVKIVPMLYVMRDGSVELIAD